MDQDIRILLLHAHSLLREGLGRLLRDQPGFQIVASCASTREALDVLEREHADIVLVDCDSGVDGGLDFVEELKKLGFGGRVLMVVARISGGMALRALQSGTSGIFMQKNPPSELVKAIRKVTSGELWVDPETMNAMAETVRSGEQQIWQQMSPREGAVLKAVLEGLTNPQIAAKLGIPESSVKYVIRKLFEKAGAKTRSQLVRIALERKAQDWLPAV
jgi:DNA-binding NarL/FixJ family response regulator